MERERNPLLERSVSQRLLSAMMMIALVLACLAGITWFIRAIDLSSTIAVPSLPGPTAAPPAPSPEADPPSAADIDPATTTSVPTSATANAPPIAKPIPLPRPRRQASVPIAGPVPLPRPRPVETGPVEETRPVEEQTSAPGIQPDENRHRAE